MYRAVGLAVAVIGLTACGPTFEAEYHATLKELEQVKLQLAEAQNKLSAADHETRNNFGYQPDQQHPARDVAVIGKLRPAE